MPIQTRTTIRTPIQDVIKGDARATCIKCEIGSGSSEAPASKKLMESTEARATVRTAASTMPIGVTTSAAINIMTLLGDRDA